ncbi:MAG: 4Fe-4S dicluster domain-containing protein [Oscillibacter sp.]|nr:4Fe-4S dicluster domain-containing protein [Oscillibacter sp.]
MRRSSTIPCTICHYCTKVCPKQIPIPKIFTAMNQRLGGGQLAESVERYQSAVKDGSPASVCITCRQCKKACPRHIPIVAKLKACTAALEG